MLVMKIMAKTEHFDLGCRLQQWASLARLDVEAPSIMVKIEFLALGVRHDLYNIDGTDIDMYTCCSYTILSQRLSRRWRMHAYLEWNLSGKTRRARMYLDGLYIICMSTNHVRSAMFYCSRYLVLAFAEMYELRSSDAQKNNAGVKRQHLFG